MNPDLPQPQDLVVASFLDRLRPPHSALPHVYWVDRTTALVACGSAVDAARVLGTYKRLVREDKVVDVPEAVLGVAMAGVSEGQATRDTPLSKVPVVAAARQTNAAVARRLIGGHLGVNLDRKAAEMSALVGPKGDRGRRIVEENTRWRALQEGTNHP